VIRIVVRELQRGATGDEPDPDLPFAADIGSERDGLSVWRERRRFLQSAEVGEAVRTDGLC
jgi:hypothetical protein